MNDSIELTPEQERKLTKSIVYIAILFFGIYGTRFLWDNYATVEMYYWLGYVKERILQILFA